jgi:predicted urease superfamily metal-dependent hydrolase
MHQAWCVKAKKFKRSGGTGLIEVLKPQMRLIDVAQNLVDMTYDIALDIHSALTNQNKSAARRARVNLNSLRQEILALRKDLNHVKNDYKK